MAGKKRGGAECALKLHCQATAVIGAGDNFRDHELEAEGAHSIFRQAHSLTACDTVVRADKAGAVIFWCGSYGDGNSWRTLRECMTSMCSPHHSVQGGSSVCEQRTEHLSAIPKTTCDSST